MAGDIKDVVISAYRPARRPFLCPAAAGGTRQGSAAGIRPRRQCAAVRACRRMPMRCSTGPRPCSKARTSENCAAIREASACFSDIGWRRHPDDRALGAFNQVLTAPFAGADHRARAVIAASIFHRYSGDEDFPQHMALAGLLDKEDERRALRLGLAWRFAFSLSAWRQANLRHYRLRMTPAKMILEVPAQARSHRGRAGAEAAGRPGRSP